MEVSSLKLQLPYSWEKECLVPLEHRLVWAQSRSGHFG